MFHSNCNNKAKNEILLSSHAVLAALIKAISFNFKYLLSICTCCFEAFFDGVDTFCFRAPFSHQRFLNVFQKLKKKQKKKCLDFLVP